MGYTPFFYNDGSTEPSDELLFSNVLTEFDSVVLWQGGIPEIPEPIDWDEPFIATSMDVGGRWVWRVTPNIDLKGAYRLVQSTDGVRFEFGGSDGFSTLGPSSILNIPGGRIHTATHGIRHCRRVLGDSATRLPARRIPSGGAAMSPAGKLSFANF